jgi:hypothetical protein
VLVIPTSVVRLVSGFGSGAKTLPSAATLTTGCIYSLSGLANVFIFLFTRSDLFIEDSVMRWGFWMGERNVAFPPAWQEEANGMEVEGLQPAHHPVASNMDNEERSTHP